MEKRARSITILGLIIAAVAAATLFLVPLVIAEDASSTASVTNSAPTASSASLDGGSVITLTANTTTTVVGEATVTDNNGCEDITSVNGTLYRTNLTGGSNNVDDNQTHYTVNCTPEADCTAGGSDLTRTYNCSFSVTHYADPTDAGSLNANTNWTFNATPTDGTEGTSDTDEQELNTLSALGLQDTTIAFGALALGADTGATNTNTTVANTGNEVLDVNLTGYGASSGDNLSMSCTIGTVPILNLEYNSTPFTYGGGIDLSNSSTELDLDIARGSDSDPIPLKEITYGFLMPSTGVEGSCTGTVSITAQSDPNTD